MRRPLERGNSSRDDQHFGLPDAARAASNAVCWALGRRLSIMATHGSVGVMHVSHRVSLLGVLVIGCGDEVAQPAPLAEVCGAAEAHRVLKLDADAALVAGGPAITRLGERLYYIAGTSKIGEDGPIAQDATVYSAGPCGEDPAVIASDVWRVFEDPSFPGLTLGCRGSASGDLVELDTTGATGPRLLLTAGCGMKFTEHGLLRLEPQTPGSARLLFFPHPIAAGDLPMVLYDGVAPGIAGSLTVRGDEILTLTPESDLLRINLLDGEVAFEQSAVRRFEVSRDGRFLVWQDFQITGAVAAGPMGSIFARDLMEGGDTLLAESGFAYGLPMMLSGDLIQVWVADEQSRVFALPSLEVSDVHPTQTVYFKLDDGRYLTSNGPRDSLLDLGTGASTTVLDEPGFRKFGREHIDLWQGEYPPYPSGDRTEAPLWRHYYDGREPLQLAERVSSVFRETIDGRTVTTLDLDDQWLGTFVLVDPGTLVERHIDDRVSWLSPALADGDPFGPGTLAYAVSDGDRSGVWIARPAAD